MRAVFLMCVTIYIYIHVMSLFNVYLLLSLDRTVLKLPVNFAGTKVFCGQMKSETLL
jgi:hypothetical protein